MPTQSVQNAAGEEGVWTSLDQYQFNKKSRTRNDNHNVSVDEKRMVQGRNRDGSVGEHNIS